MIIYSQINHTSNCGKILSGRSETIKSTKIIVLSHNRPQLWSTPLGLHKRVHVRECARAHKLFPKCTHHHRSRQRSVVTPKWRRRRSPVILAHAFSSLCHFSLSSRTQFFVWRLTCSFLRSFSFNREGRAGSTLGLRSGCRLSALWGTKTWDAQLAVVF